MQEPTLASLTSQPWWRTDAYDGEHPLDEALQAATFTGSNGIALVKAWPGGKTDPGWGRETFMDAYLKNDFNARRILYGYEAGKWAFAIVMRSVSMICVDIDGKNGGLEYAKRLGMLPPTLAETSKSGNGYHLFYLVEDVWNDEFGFDAYYDYIGIEQGVDIRSVGCVYHHPQQRWNSRPPAPAPQHLIDLMKARRQKQEHTAARVAKTIETGDDMEMMMLQEELVSDLKKPIPQGKRNTTLFAIGQKLKQAQVPGWEEMIDSRARQVGLDADEADKLVQNITRYN